MTVRIVLAAGLLCSAASPVHAGVIGVVCGTTVTKSIVLQADETCSHDGITIGADTVTIDLGGHTLHGPGAAGTIGIDVGTHSGVTIKNGTVFLFGTAITTGASAPHLKLSDVTASASVAEGANLVTTDVAIDRCAFVANGGEGLRLAAQSGKVSNSIAAGNAATGYLIVAGAATMTKVTSADNGRGIDVANGATVRIQGSRFLHNQSWGVLLESGGTISGSTMIGNAADGVMVRNFDATLTGNLIAGNVQNGINLNGSANTTVTKNRVVGNHADGIHVDAGATDAVLESNTVVGNGGEGLSIASASTTLTKNVANANTNSGVNAGAAIDGGGNTAHANGDAACSAVVCPPAFVGKPGTTTPVCNQPVTTSIKLNDDSPVCTGSSGLIVGADHVTIDLNGHMLRGDGSVGHAGIVVGSHVKVTIQNGMVQNFNTGVSSVGNGLKLVNVELRGNAQDGADLLGDGIAVSKSTFVLNGGAGLHLAGGAAPKVSASFFVANGADGLHDFGTGGTLSSLTAAGNVAHGVFLADPAAGHLSGSTLADNGGAGLDLPGVDMATSTIAKSTIVGNQAEGVLGPGAGSTFVFDANLIGGNLLDGLKLGPSSAGLVVTKNSLFGNGKNGLIISPVIDSGLVKSNMAVGNGQGGIELDVAGVTFTKNIADANVDGIFAVDGDINGGGNEARGNTENQCSGNIVCN
jgi:parallel beta-helix repeat protein